MKTLQSQLLIVQLSRQVLEEGGNTCDRNITGAVHQHLTKREVKEILYSVLVQYESPWIIIDDTIRISVCGTAGFSDWGTAAHKESVA